jgi:hypothetical protein
MPEIKSVESLYLIIGFLTPGLIATYIRSQFVTGRGPRHTEAALSYVVISIVYYALAYPAVEYVLSITGPGRWKALCWFGLIFVGPVFFGLLLGLNTQREWFRRILRRLKMNPVHAMPTAWDWRFGAMREEWVMVTLKDGTKFSGYCGANSFMSSDPNERDIYIQQVFDRNKKDQWIPRSSSVLIAGGTIQTVEFWPIKSNGEKNDGKENRQLRRLAKPVAKRLPAKHGTAQHRERRIQAAKRPSAHNRPRRAF